MGISEQGFSIGPNVANGLRLSQYFANLQLIEYLDEFYCVQGGNIALPTALGDSQRVCLTPESVNLILSPVLNF